MSQPTPLHPTDRLVTLIVTLLAPMFLYAGGGEIALARSAAFQTINAYCVRDKVSLIAIAKILAFDLATLSSLSLSMADKMSVSLALRLRGNANSLDRAAERNRRMLEQHRCDTTIPVGAAGLTEAGVAASIAEAQALVRQARDRTQPEVQSAAAPPTVAPITPTVATVTPIVAPPAAPSATPVATRTPMPEGRRRAAWAEAMTAVAAEFAAGMHTLSPAQRSKEMMRAEVLSKTATALMSGTVSPFANDPLLAAGRPRSG
jgi:hypothetical protein